MFRVVSSIAAALLTFAIATVSAAADDRDTCKQWRSSDAVAACTRLIKKNPNEVEYYEDRGNAHQGAGNYDRAIADYSQAIKINPKYGSAYSNRCWAYNNKREYDQAIIDCNKALELGIRATQLYNNIANAYYGKGDYDRSITYYNQAIQVDPNYAPARGNRGGAYEKKGDLVQARADYEESLRLDPNYAYARAGLDRVRAALGTGGGQQAGKPALGNDRETCKQWRNAEAIAACTRLINQNPDEVVNYEDRGNAYQGAGDYDHAVADYDHAIRLNPRYGSAYSNRCWAYNNKHEYDRAIVDCNKAVELGIRATQLYNNIANAYYGKGDYDRAITNYDQAIQIDPNYAPARGNRGGAYEKKGDLTQARADYEESLRLDPNYSYARAGLDRVRAAIASLAPAPAKPAPQIVLPEVPPPPVVPSQVPPQVGAALPVAGKRALVIGIDSYPNLARGAQLERAVADAEAVGDKLATLGFQVTRLTSPQQGTLQGLLSGFEDFKKRVAKDDMVVLFYAGHGMSLSDGSTYLVPSDVSESSLKGESTARHVAISERELTEGLRQERAGIIVAVIDACRNDLFTQAMGRALGDIAPTRGLRPAETVGVYKLYSASEGQVALDRLPGTDGSRNSVFTRVFLRALTTPGLDLNRLGAQVRDEVHDLAATADHQQTPAVYDKLIGSARVYFVPGSAGR
jgi:tetratricopeptide (TPR) repeat protein